MALLPPKSAHAVHLSINPRETRSLFSSLFQDKKSYLVLKFPTVLHSKISGKLSQSVKLLGSVRSIKQSASGRTRAKIIAAYRRIVLNQLRNASQQHAEAGQARRGLLVQQQQQQQPAMHWVSE